MARKLGSKKKERKKNEPMSEREREREREREKSVDLKRWIHSNINAGWKKKAIGLLSRRCGLR